MLLKQSSKILANKRPNIKKGDHNGEHAEKTKGHLQVKGVTVSSLAHLGRTHKAWPSQGQFLLWTPNPIISTLILKSLENFRERKTIRRDNVIVVAIKMAIRKKNVTYPTHLKITQKLLAHTYYGMSTRRAELCSALPKDTTYMKMKHKNKKSEGIFSAVLLCLRNLISPH